MGKIVQPGQPRTYHEGKTNTVLSIAEAKVVAVRWVDSDSAERMALCMVFGTDQEDGGPGVFIMANEQQMGETLKRANTALREGVRAKLAEASGLPEAPPESLGDVSVEGDPETEDDSLDTATL